MPKAEKTNTTPAPDDSPIGAVGEMEPLLHDLEAEIGLLGHVANSRTQIAPGELIAIENHLMGLHRRLAGLWDKAWDDDLARRFGKNPPTGATTALSPAEGADAELIRLCDRLIEMNGEEEALYVAIPDDDEREKAVEPLNEQHFEIRARLFEIGRPVTRAGAEAVARAAWVSGTRAPNGTPIATYLSDWLRLAACAYLANTAGPTISDNTDGEGAKAEPAAETPPTIRTIAAYVKGLSVGITTMCDHMDGGSDSAISTISTALALALEKAHPGAALIMGRASAMVFATERRAGVAEYLEKTMGAKTPAPEGDLGDLFKGNRPDATALHLTRELMKIDARVQVLNELPNSEEAGMDAVLDRQHALFDTLIDTPAKTAGGWRAKAEVLVAAIRADISDPDPEHRLAISLAADLMAGIKPDR